MQGDDNNNNDSYSLPADTTTRPANHDDDMFAAELRDLELQLEQLELEQRSLRIQLQRARLRYVEHTKAPSMQSMTPPRLTEVDNLQGIYPLKNEWVFGCSLKTRLADQTKTLQLKWLWPKDSMNSRINLRLVEQTQEINFKLEGSGGSTLGDTLRKQ